MDHPSKVQQLVTKCQDLETTVRLWVAANEAKAQRILELEAECSRLQQRVARLGRRAGQGHKQSRQQQVRNAR